MLERVMVVVVLVLGGCVVDKQLGNTDGEDGDDGADAAASTDGTSTGGAGGTLGMSGAGSDSGASDPSASGDGGPGSISITATGGDDDGALDSCIDWTPPPFDCGADEGATMLVTVDPSFSAGEDMPCTVGATMPAGKNTDAFELDCDDGTHLVEVTTTPHVIPGFVTGQQVLLTFVQAQDPIFFAPSFTIRAQSGELLLAHLNEYDHEPRRRRHPARLSASQLRVPGHAQRCDLRRRRRRTRGQPHSGRVPRRGCPRDALLRQTRPRSTAPSPTSRSSTVRHAFSASMKAVGPATRARGTSFGSSPWRSIRSSHRLDRL